MRMTFNALNRHLQGTIQDRYGDLAKLQEQLSTGKRVLTPADDPVASTKIIELNQNLARIKQYNNNINIVENNLQLEESTLDSVRDLMQRVREIAVQAGNTATYSKSEYKSLAAEVDARLDELLNLVNTRNAGGDYIFAGYKGADRPFVGDASSGFRYEGNDGQTFIKVSDGAKIATSDSGKNLFVDIPAANNSVRTSPSAANAAEPPGRISMGQVVDQAAYDAFYPEDMVITFQLDSDVVPPAKNFTITERSTGNVIQPYQNYLYTPGEEFVVNGVSVNITGTPASAAAGGAGDRFFIDSSPSQDILTTLARFSDAMKRVDGTVESKDFLSRTVEDTLNGINNAQVNVLETTSNLGARFNSLQSTRDLHLDTELVSREILSELQDLNYAEAATRLSAQTLVLDAAQATFVRVSQLSLFGRL